eukprot:GFUD01011959.1.p1 GENE.GFUD01011959.1~~GFUD01011959.1.p1  ORF type:complete len:247 (+),score=56.19 GFUD01011959.1:85-825(+)
MMTLTVGLLAALIGCFSITNAFTTAKCNHQEILDSFDNYKTCYAKKKDKIEENFCLGFKIAELCSHSSYANCFEPEEVDELAQNQKIEIRIIGTQTLKNLKFPDLLADSLYSRCTQAPSKAVTESYDQRSVYWLDYVSTDGLCDSSEKTKVEEETTNCFREEGENFKTEFKENVKKARGNLKSTICAILQYTVANCARKEYPSCFSEREEKYIKGLMVNAFEVGYGLIQKLSQGTKIPNLAKECLQ